MDKITEVLTRGVEKIYPTSEALEERLRSGEKMKLYQGFDPSKPSLHLGNLVGLLKLRQFQDLGHEVIFLVGDFTGMIGDPTDKSATRPKLSREQVLSNAKAWEKQIGQTLKLDGDNPAKILFNSQWLDKISFRDLIEITSNFTAQQMLERDFFQRRLKEEKPIYLHEFLYPVAQAIDSVEMGVDLEVGGNDQTFNMLAGRTLVKVMKGKEKFVLTMKLLTDPSGIKAGKTTGNAVFLDQPAEEIYGHVMAFSDEMTSPAFELLTLMPLEEIDSLKEDKQEPMALKKKLAFEIVQFLFSTAEAQKAADHFERVIQKKEIPAEIVEADQLVPASQMTFSELVFNSGGTASHGEAKRLISQGGVELDGQKITDPQQIVDIHGGEVLRVGRRGFYKVKVES